MSDTEEWTRLELVSKECDKCGQTFTTDSKLQHHQPCFQKSKYFLSHESSYKFKCRYCDKRFEHLDTLLRHVLFHLNEKEYACNHCDERFHRKQGVTNHIVRIHHKSQKYHCKKKSCSKRFATPERMHQHYTLVHQNKVDSSECPVCGSVYRQRRNMLQHMNNAHEESDAAMFLKRVEV